MIVNSKGRHDKVGKIRSDEAHWSSCADMDLRVLCARFGGLKLV